MSRNDSPPSDFLPALQSPQLAQSPFLDYIRNSEFKRLLGQVTSALNKDGVKTVAVLSFHPKEGRTFTIAALSLAYAVLLHKRVLIVNTSLTLDDKSVNIRKIYEEQLQFAQGAHAAQGSRMIDLISPQMDPRNDTGADTVDFLIGGYINTFKHNYDLILIDTSPLSVTDNGVIDPVVIAGQADGSLFVTSEHSMNRKSLGDAKEILDRAQLRVVGTIHNKQVKK